KVGEGEAEGAHQPGLEQAAAGEALAGPGPVLAEEEHRCNDTTSRRRDAPCGRVEGRPGRVRARRPVPRAGVRMAEAPKKETCRWDPFPGAKLPVSRRWGWPRRARPTSSAPSAGASCWPRRVTAARSSG